MSWAAITAAALAASIGVAALLVASEPAFVALKLAGAAYLVKSKEICVPESALANRSALIFTLGHETQHALSTKGENHRQALLASGLQRSRAGLVLGSVLQLAVIATGVLLPAMYVLGLIFAAAWLYLLKVRRDLTRATAPPPTPSPGPVTRDE